jgi:glycosyltransferase 2 family protein
MDRIKLKLSIKTFIFPLLGLIGFFLYIYIFQVDLLGILETARSVNPILYFIAIICGLMEVLFYTVSWRMLTNHLNIKMTLKKAFLYVWYGLYVDIIVPAESISGEVARAYLLARDQCGIFGKVVASLFMHRLLGMVMNVIALIIGISLLLLEGRVNSIIVNFIVFIGAGITIAIAALTVLSLKLVWMLKIIDFSTRIVERLFRGKWTLAKLREEAFQMTDHFHTAMTEYSRSLKPLAKSFFYLSITWFFSLSVPYVVFQALGYPISWSILLITAAIVLAVKSIPIGIPFEVGLPEAVMTTLYFSMGIPASIAATATILSRIITLWFRFFVGFGAQQLLELKPVITTKTTEMEKTKN